MAKLDLAARIDAARLKEQQARARGQRLETVASASRRKAENGEKFVIGGTVLTAMQHDPEFRKHVVGLLDQYVTKPYDRERVKRWLPPSPPL